MQAVGWCCCGVAGYAVGLSMQRLCLLVFTSVPCVLPWQQHAAAAAGPGCRFVEHAKAVSPSVQLEYHVEPDEPHCWCVVGMPHLLAKGLPVLVPFFAKAAAAAGSATAK